MIVVIKTVHGTFNLVGTNDDGFCLQGNLTEEELKELQDAIKEQLP